MVTQSNHVLKSLSDKCSNSSNTDGDKFVGVKVENGNIKIKFPMGYKFNTESESELRKDIILLIRTIQRFVNDKNQKKGMDLYRTELDSDFPLTSYQYIIQDYMSNGYYIEKEEYFTSADRGKISWKRTIQQKKPIFSGGNVAYLDFVVKKNRLDDNGIIRKIHEWCVYESLSELGWLYNLSMPRTPKIKYDKKMFERVLREEIGITHNDRKRDLLYAMKAVVMRKEKASNETNRIICGVKRFEYIWESMVERIYGLDNEIENKKYHPKSRWHIEGDEENSKEKSPLRPDTIMIVQGQDVSKNKVYILDAKYYKYGIKDQQTKSEHSYLPGTDSIQKQITYAEYLLSEKFKNNSNVKYQEENIYNAFLMPCDKSQYIDMFPFAKSIGYATADWKENKNPYEKVVGLLVDTKELMKYATYGQGTFDRNEMAELIERVVKGV